MKHQIARQTCCRAAIAASCACIAVGAAAENVRPKTIETSAGFEMALLSAGEFMRGNDSGRRDERPARMARVDAFYIDVRPVTQDQHMNLTGENPARWKNPDNPVEQIRWSDAARFLNARSIAEGLEPCYDLA